MLQYVLYGLFILTCIVLVVAVLLQPGKADAGALFSSSISSTAFGPRGTQTILAKITIGAAALFMLIALTLSLPIFGTRSVLQTTADESTPAATPTPAASPAAAPAAPGGATTASPAQAGTDAGAAPANTSASPAAPAANSNAAPAASPQAQASPARRR